MSMYKQTVMWIKQIPHKLGILLDNLYTMASSLAQILVGIYTIAKVVPALHGYVATGALIAGAIVVVDGGFKLVKFLLGGAK